MKLSEISPALAAMNVPSAVTLLGGCAGGTALVGAASGRPALVMGGIALALCTDKLDGMLARRLNQQSDFGAQLDSLSDALSFVAAPALSAVLLLPNVPGGLIAALYLICGLTRLAAFHQLGLVTVRGRECFVGLPTVAAASVFLVALMLAPRLGSWPVALALGVTAPLMVSGLHWPKRGFHDVFCTACAVVAIGGTLR